MTAFGDRLNVSVTLGLASGSYTASGGDVTAFELALEPHGFRARAEVRVANDADYGGSRADRLLAGFADDALVTASISVVPTHRSAEAPQEYEPLAVTGIVVARAMTEAPLLRSADLALLERRYQFEFVDPAGALWTQHFPCQLFTEKSYKDVIESYSGGRIAVSSSWGFLTAARPLLFVHLPPAERASFYDFVIWLVESQGGVFRYDYAAGGYAIDAAKPAASGGAQLFGDDVASQRIVYPAVRRHTPCVLNAYSEAASIAEISRELAAPGVRHDYVARYPVPQDFDDRRTLEQARAADAKAEVELAFGRYPSAALAVGGALSLPAARRFSAASALDGLEFRVASLHVAARAADEPRPDEASPSGAFELRFEAKLEQADDPVFRLPPYVAPRYPGFVEGKIVSALGGADDKTFDFESDARSGATSYTVKVPLWGEQQVAAPFEPGQGGGAMYLPLYRDQRVLLALDLDAARVERLLDWRADAKLGKDEQGESIVFGKNPTNRTTLSHVYEDEQPVFGIARKNAKDGASLVLKEGNLLLRVAEDG